MEWTSNCWRPQLNARGQVGGNGVVQVWKMSTIEWIREWHSVSAGNHQTPLPLFHYSTFHRLIDWLMGTANGYRHRHHFCFKYPQSSMILWVRVLVRVRVQISNRTYFFGSLRDSCHIFPPKWIDLRILAHTTHSHILKYLYICRGTQMIIDNRQSTMNLCCHPKGHLQD